MQVARVVGTVVSTQKHRKFEGAKLLLVQPLNLDDTPRGATLLAVDGVGAGVNERVLIVLEGRVAGKHALVTMLTDQVDRALFEAGADLKVVANVAVGYNNIDVPAARERG